MVAEEASASGEDAWSREQDKAFENALAVEESEGADDAAGDERWERLAALVPGKTAEELRRHYELLVDDVNDIEAGRIPFPDEVAGGADGGGGTGKKGGSAKDHGEGSGGKGSRSELERRKGIAWSEEEHRLFLLGLDKYGKGDWRSISRNFVISRTPTQVASHAQKYFIRLNSMNKERRRSSIHDITSVNKGDVSVSQAPITGQANGPAAVPGKLTKQATAKSSNPPPGVNMYGTAIGQPVRGPIVSAVGAPVSLPVTTGTHIGYAVRAPVTGGVAPGAPVSMPPMSYPIPSPSSHVTQAAQITQ